MATEEQRRVHWASGVGALLGVASLSVAAGALYTSLAAWFGPEDQPQVAAPLSEASTLRSELGRLRGQVDRMAPIVASIRPSDSNRTPQMRALASQMAALAGRQERLEGIIVRDPARALEMPLLQRDLQNAREITKAEMDGIKGSIDRLYTLIGGIGLMLVTLAATSWFSLRRKGDSEAK